MSGWVWAAGAVAVLAWVVALSLGPADGSDLDEEKDE